MNLGELSIILASVGIILLIAELFLPTHGVLAFVGIGSLISAIVTSFLINVWLGFGSIAGSVAITPLIGAWLVNVWPRTRSGRQFVLPSHENIPRPLEPLPVQIGQTG